MEKLIALWQSIKGELTQEDIMELMYIIVEELDSDSLQLAFDYIEKAMERS